MSLDVSLATWDHDRVMALHEGRVTVPGVDLACTILPTSKLFPLAVQEARFDVTELSLSSYLLQVSRGTCAYTAIPAFVSRAFRHSGFFARTDAGLTGPADLAGRRVGVPEYQMTAALWMRGLLRDTYGVDSDGIHWRTGALEEGVRRERLDLALPKGMIVEPIQDGQTLVDLLLDGDIDGLLAPKPPTLFLEGDKRLVRLIPDFERAEQDYYRQTGFFPIMHLIAIRKTLADAHPWLAKAMLDAFTEARDLAVARIEAIWPGNANRLSIPWLLASMERTKRIMGPDYWSYGFTANHAEIEAACRYSSEQHLAAREVTPEELFHPTVLGP